MKYPPLNTKELLDILGTTIKRDDDNKFIAFLCQLSAYTEDSQLNLSFNAPSSSGKSFIPIEIAKLFPSEDVLELGYVSPTSFFHSASEYNKETEEYLVDLSRKIIIFLDQPHNMLLEHLRPLLSHDKKEIKVQITDKQQKNGLRAKKIVLRGYPAVIFCSAGLRMDEQEATRFLLLSPEVTQEKIREGILESLKKASDRDSYNEKTELDLPRQQLKERIKAIREANISDIRITVEDQDYIIKHFFGLAVTLKPRHQRDIRRLIAIIKALALLNLWHRKTEGSRIVASRIDIDEAFDVWDRISITQELNIPPYVYKLYEDIILTTYKEKNADCNDDFVEITGTIGVTRQEILNKHYTVYGRMLDTLTLRQQILPILNQVGLITEELDPIDKRNKLIYPIILPKYSESDGGVNVENKKILEDVRQIFGGGEIIE
ncbi:MAG TPA: hypothetical protein VMR16_01530 [Candidatus Saccharimonadales bacterium]|nr:hypothetical protein [Candidatus Saccharimonadales bacterium]